MESNPQFRRETLDAKETYIADVYSDVHVFKRHIKHSSAEGLLHALRFLRDIKKSKKRWQEKKIDEIILNGDIIDHLCNRSAFDVGEYLNLLRNGSELDYNRAEELRKRNKKVNNHKISELNVLINNINNTYSGVDLKTVSEGKYNIEIASDVFGKIVDELKEGIREGSIVYIIGNHENVNELEHLGINYAEDYVLRNLHFEHGHKYDGPLARAFEDGGKKFRAWRIKHTSNPAVELAKKSIDVVDGFLDIAEKIANKIEFVGRAGINLFYRENKKKPKDREKEKYRIRGHLHKYYFNKKKKLLVTGTWYTEGPGLLISQKAEEGYEEPIYFNRTVVENLKKQFHSFSKVLFENLTEYQQEFYA